MESPSDPASLRDREDVPFHEETRVVGREQFEGLRERYETIDGVVVVGVTSEGAVLLMGPDEWSPPGGDVEPGEGWAAAARRNVEELTGVTVEIDGPELVERTVWRLDGDPESRFATDSVFFRASLADDESAFREDPCVAADLDHEYFGDGDALEFEWFEKVPEDVHPNHEDHVRLFLD